MGVLIVVVVGGRTGDSSFFYTFCLRLCARYPMFAML
jgi:hypothetical protein